MAKVGNFKVSTYGDGNDQIKGKQLKAVFGQEGNDILTGLSRDYNKPTLMSGGAGDDTYRLRGDFNIILDGAGGKDKVIAKNFSYNTTDIATIEGRHLIVADELTGSVMVFFDFKEKRNNIEKVKLADRTLSGIGIVENYQSLEGYVGNYSWVQVNSQLFNLANIGLNSNNIESAINLISDFV